MLFLKSIFLSKVIGKFVKGFVTGGVAGEAVVLTANPNIDDIEKHAIALGVALVNALVQAGFNAWKNRKKAKE